MKETDNWGKRGLAYEINDHREGYYCFYRFKGGSEILNELTRQLRIDENVIRHMIVKDEAKGRPRPEPVREGTPVETVHLEDAEEDV